MQSAMFFPEREFTRRRELECNCVYPCQVSSQAGNDVILKLNDTTVRFEKGIAQRVSRCLKDAFLVNFGNTVNVLFTSGKRKSKLERVFKKDAIGRWNYKANGRLKCRLTDNEIYSIKITAVQGGDERTSGLHS